MSTQVLERQTVANQPASEPVSLIATVRALANGPLAELADDIDRRGIYPKSVLQRLASWAACPPISTRPSARPTTAWPSAR